MDGIEKARSSRSSSSHNILSSGIRLSLSKNHRTMDDVFAARSSGAGEDDEEALKWAAIEKLPTYDRLRTSIINSFVENDDGNTNKFGPREVDVRKLDMDDRQRFINALLKVADEDNEKFLRRFRNRLDK